MFAATAQRVCIKKLVHLTGVQGCKSELQLTEK